MAAKRRQYDKAFKLETVKLTTELGRTVPSVSKDLVISEKSYGHLHTTPEMKYQFIHNHRSEFRVERMCRVSEVSKSGYCRWITSS